MRFSRPRLRTLPLLLRWVLALVMILNGGVAAPVMADTEMANSRDDTAHAMPPHCHHHDASASSENAENPPHKCPCCTDGNGCQCGCIVTLALPMTFRDLRPFAPQTLTDPLSVLELATTPRHRLLRPPIS